MFIVALHIYDTFVPYNGGVEKMTPTIATITILDENDADAGRRVDFTFKKHTFEMDTSYCWMIVAKVDSIIHFSECWMAQFKENVKRKKNNKSQPLPFCTSILKLIEKANEQIFCR